MTAIAARDVAATLAALRARAPLVHNITNLVVANSTANALLAVGASPAMVEGEEEAAAFAAVAAALVINLGTMSAPRAQAMRLAAAAARAAGTPWVLDPVAVGAIAYRSAVAVELLAHKPQVVRGNASEIIALARLSRNEAVGAAGRGVDSLAQSADALHAARQLAVATGGAVVISGATDYATDGARAVAIDNGHPMMTRVTGLGCTATAIIGACLAVEAEPIAAAAHGMVLIGLAGETAAGRANGPGSLQPELLDALYNLDAGAIAYRARVREVA